MKNLREFRIINKKGFTILEILIAVSIFGVISLMTFSVINYVPKLVKTESSQFNERTYVRRAVTEITGTIQSASNISSPSLEFTMPNSDIVEYELTGENVNKLVNDVPQSFMESVKEFSITTSDNRLFNIHIKTAKEGKVYDFKVEKRNGASTSIDAEISTITPTAVTFDKNDSPPQDIDITLNLNGNLLTDIRNGTDILDLGTDYTISGNTVTFKKEYLNTQSGTIQIVFNVTNGVDPKLTVQIIEKSSGYKIEGNSFADDLVRMEYPGNLLIDPYDDKWVITVTNATVEDEDEIDSNDLKIEGLPGGINFEAARGAGNTIVITLSGSTSAPVAVTRSIWVEVKASAVTAVAGVTALNSDPIEVILLPGATFASPEHNLLFTNEVYFKNDVEITGDIVIGRNRSMTELGNNTKINGYIYADSSITVKNDAVFGKPDKKMKIFVKGSVDFQNKAKLYGDIFYRDSFHSKNEFELYGNKVKTAVEIPELTLPEPRSEEWYENNGYTMVDNQSQKVTFKSNGKYYFRTEYELKGVNNVLDNVTFVGKDNIKFETHFTGSGIIFAPYGEIYFKNGVTFTGMCVSERTDLQTDSKLIFKRYAELPFD